MFVSPDMARLGKELTSGGYASRAERVKDILKSPLFALEKANEIFEMGTRLGIAGKEFKDGMSRAEQEAAAMKTRDTTLDYSRKGHWGRVLNQVIAFWNANAQDSNKFYREVIVKRDKRVIIKSLLTITLPSVLIELMYHDDPDYEELPEWQKNMFFPVKVPEIIAKPWNRYWNLPEDRGVFLCVIPKPFFMGAAFGNVPRLIIAGLMDYGEKDKKTDIAGSLKSLVGAAIPGVVPTVAIPFLEIWANKSVFFDSSIVPPDKKDALPLEQYAPWTSKTARKAAEILADATGWEVSPAKLQHAALAWTAGGGKYGLDGIDKLLDLFDSEPDKARPASMPWDYPVLKKAFPNSMSGERSLEKFYDTYSHASAMAQSYEECLRTGDKGRAEEIAKMPGFDKYVYVSGDNAKNKLAPLAKELTKLRRDAHAVGIDADGTWKGDPNGQRRELNRLRLEMVDKAREMDKWAGEYAPKSRGGGMGMPKAPSMPKW